jgi:hypothetical protein
MGKQESEIYENQFWGKIIQHKPEKIIGRQYVSQL